MAWLLRDDDVLASIEVAGDRRSRRRGLLGRKGIDGALWLPGVRSVHTVGMRFAIDVAHVDGRGQVLRTATMARHRVGRPVRRAAAVLEAEAGSFDRWGLVAGQSVEVRE